MQEECNNCKKYNIHIMGLPEKKEKREKKYLKY